MPVSRVRRVSFGPRTVHLKIQMRFYFDVVWPEHTAVAVHSVKRMKKRVVVRRYSSSGDAVLNITFLTTTLQHSVDSCDRVFGPAYIHTWNYNRVSFWVAKNGIKSNGGGYLIFRKSDTANPPHPRATCHGSGCRWTSW